MIAAHARAAAPGGPTPAWRALARSLRASHRFARHTDDAIRFVLAIGDDAVRVGIVVRPASAYDTHVVSICADLGSVTRALAIDPFVALAINAHLAFGALALDGEALVLRAVVATDGLSPDALELRVQRLAAEAAAIKRQLTRRAPDADAFTHYGD